MSSAVEIYNTKHGLYVSKFNVTKYTKSCTYTHTSKIGDKVFKTTQHGYQIYGCKTYFARFCGIYADIKASNKVILHNCIKATSANIPCTIKPLDERQSKVYEHLISTVYTPDKIKYGVAGCTLVAGTGIGKTYISGMIMAALGYCTLIVVPNKTIRREWLKMFEAYMPDVVVGEYSSSRKIDGDVVVFTAKSLIKQTYAFGDKVVGYEEYLSKFGLVIYDEVHNYATKGYKEIFWRTNFLCKLGLTATPDERLDCMDIMYKHHVGNEIRVADLMGIVHTNWVCTVYAVKYNGPVQYTCKITNDDGWMQTQLMCQQFADDPYRTQLIINRAREMLQRHKNVFIFAEHRNYVWQLESHLSGTSVGVLMGGCTDADYAEAITKQIIIITYMYGKEGLSVPKMNAIIFAHPRKSHMRQIIGRILRCNDGEPREIIDIIDQKTPIKTQYRERKKIYIEKEFTIVDQIIPYTDIKINDKLQN